MPYMSKAKLAAEAERLGLDLTGLDYQAQNKLVNAALNSEGVTSEEVAAIMDEEVSGGWSPSWSPTAAVPSTPQPVAQAAPQAQAPEHPAVPVQQDSKPEVAARKYIKRTIISPEMAQTPIQLLKYDEDLGDDIEVEERTFNINDVASLKMKREYTSGTYVVRGANGKRVVAQSTLPKENAGIVMDPSTPIAVPLVKWNGTVGYLWTHSSLPNVKELLQASGYYERYRKTFSADNPQNLWYAASQVLVADMNTVHYVFREIERLAQNER